MRFVLASLASWRLLVLAAVVSTAGTSLAQTQTYIGAERCKSCHPFEYRVWAQGPHAKAHESLTPAQIKDSKCNTCHMTQTSDTKVRFTGIQCEQCHGPGKYYHPEYVMKDKELARAVGLIDPKPAHCQQCHTKAAPSVKPFDFVTLWAEIDHGKDARTKAHASAAPAAPAK